MSFSKRLLSSAPPPFVASENFKVVTYTGNDVTQNIDVGIKPDLVWIKNRNNSSDSTFDHSLFDSQRGTYRVRANSSGAANDYASHYGGITDNGFQVKNGLALNDADGTYVAWCWKAGGGTTSTNSNGSINSTVQANEDTGFSIATYTGSGSAATIGHGLPTTPEMIIVKSTSDAYEWKIWHKDLSSGYQLLFNTAGQASDSSVWTTTTPTSTVFSIGTNVGVNGGSKNYIAYCFTPIDGFSKFGSYTGNSSDNGPIVETGFEPAFLMIKNASDLGSWFMYDNKRNTSNPRKNYVLANASNVEASDMGGVDFLSNGFQIKENHDDVNDTGDEYIYMAFAADPDTEQPTVAKSFSTVTYTGNGGTQDIETVGFRPSLVWIKERSSGKWHNLHDQVRGFGSSTLFSNSTAAANTTEQHLTRSLPYGFTVNIVDS